MMLSVLGFLLMANTYADSFFLDGNKARTLFINLDVSAQAGMKEYQTQDRMIYLKCNIALYQPFCELLIRPYVSQKSWKDFLSKLDGPDVNQSSTTIIHTQDFSLRCREDRKSCQMILQYE